MFISPNKAQSLARDLSNRLTLRIANSASGRLNTIAQSFDSNGFPVLTLSRGGTVTEGSPVAIIYIVGVPMVSKDIFGNSQIAAAPHITYVGFELTSTANDPIIKLFDISAILFEVIPMGTQLQFVAIPNGTAVTLANLLTAAATAANVEAYDWLYWPTKGV